MKAPYKAQIEEMLARLPSIPYPGSSKPGARLKWKKACIAAGYPRCEECTMPIARSLWMQSITECPTCRGIRLGYFEYRQDRD